MAAAHAAATAAMLSLETGSPVQQVAYDKLHRRLLADVQVLAVPAD
jgi:hypothetical protein